MEVPPEQIHLYGCAAVQATGEGDLLKVTDLVEKPDPAHAPSNYAIIGRYVLDPGIIDVLRTTEPGRGGEIQLTDALQRLATEDKPGSPVHGVVFTGRRYDTGDRGDYLRAIVTLACERADLGPDFRTWLHSYVTHEMPSVPSALA
jgi:UTP--glucose-1-phosphate uridylyltransferase